MFKSLVVVASASALALVPISSSVAARHDGKAPSTPKSLSVSATLATSLTLAWQGSTDNVGVAGYAISVNSAKVGTTTDTSYTIANLSCGTSYTLAVAAFDSSGNTSSPATTVATTSACPVSTSTSTTPPTTTTTTTTATTTTTTTTTTSASTTAPGFVTRVGTTLYLNGGPYRFAGFNFFQANMTGTIANCSSWAANSELDPQLTAMGPGHNVIRAWFFQDMATVNGSRDWSAFDHTLQVAAAHGYKVIATLADQWNYCEGPYKDESWYTGGYKSTVLPGDSVSYRQWVSEVVSRYKNNPTVTIWELMNEPEIQTSATSTSCPSDAEAVMQSWAGDISTLIKSFDPNHLVSLGTGGNGNCGLIEGDYAKVYALPNLDICSYHDYWGPTIALDNDPYNGIQLRIDQCKSLTKPIYAGEAGIKLQDASSLSERASLFATKVAAQITAGSSGFVAWNWAHQSDLDYRIGAGDPTTTTVSTLAFP